MSIGHATISPISYYLLKYWGYKYFTYHLGIKVSYLPQSGKFDTLIPRWRFVINIILIKILIKIINH